MPRKSVRTRVPPPASSDASDASRFQLLVQGVTDYALYMLSAEGVVTSWNAGAERMKGYTPDEIIGRHFSQFFTGEDRDAGLPQKALAEARQVGRFESEGWRVRKDGTRFWVSAVLDAIHDEAGAFVGFAKITRDLTERHAAQRALADSERHFRMLVQGVTDYAIYLLDPSGIVTNWNAGAERIKGYAAEEIVGRHFSVFYPPEQRAAGAPAKALAIATREGRFDGGGLADSQGWHPLLCIRGDRRNPRRRRRNCRIRQNHAATSPSDARQKKRCVTASGSSA